MIPCAALADVTAGTFAELKAAFDNAPSGQETVVKLTSDIEVTEKLFVENTKSIVLDFNKQQVTVPDSFIGRPFNIKQGGKLTVKGDGTVDTTNAEDAYGTFDNYGSLYIYNGTYSGYVYAYGAIVKTRPGSYTEIYDGTYQDIKYKEPAEYCKKRWLR